MNTKTKRDLEAMEQRRHEGMRLLARGVSQAEVARRCGVSRVSAWRWQRQRQVAPSAAWKRRPLGRPAKLSAAHKQRLEKALLQGAQAHGFLNDLWTLPRVAALIHCLCGVRLHPGHVWRVLGAMGWSVQRPARQALQRDEMAIARWKKHTWPALKKSV
jgi:transposase